jgi:4-hydroxy-tetrahydrodipicolinate reductase
MTLEIGRHERAHRHDHALLTARVLDNSRRQLGSDAASAKRDGHFDVRHDPFTGPNQTVGDGQLAVHFALKARFFGVPFDVHLARVARKARARFKMCRMIRLCLIGAGGRMGLEIVRSVARDPEVHLVSAIGSPRSAGTDAGELAGIEALHVELETDLPAASIETLSQVALDVSVPAAVMSNARTCIELQIPLVIGATGLSETDLEELDALAKKAQVPVLVAPNFAIGAILMMRFAREAAKYFDNAEILEFHHDKKLDAPSGTAFKTALAMREARGEDFKRVGGDDANAPGARGGEIGGVSIHSIRQPGFLAHQEVIFGMLGQTLHIRHDAISRECYMPGVLLAIKRVRDLEAGVHFGLETIL